MLDATGIAKLFAFFKIVFVAFRAKLIVVIKIKLGLALYLTHIHKTNLAILFGFFVDIVKHASGTFNIH
jgi:hypothetical protein